MLTLPSLRTLHDYKNAIRPTAGSSNEVIEELCKNSKILKSFWRFVVLSFDEMKIQQKVVFDKHLEELIGYKGLGDPKKKISRPLIMKMILQHM